MAKVGHTTRTVRGALFHNRARAKALPAPSKPPKRTAPRSSKDRRACAKRSPAGQYSGSPIF